MPLETVLALAIAVSLTFYALMAGADFGSGVWALLATGPRAAAQRKLVAEAIGPIWEANHVWMILAVVILFTAFPPAFATIAVALHVPVTLLLIGIVLRGSAFAFQSHGHLAAGTVGAWGRVFAGSCVACPLLIGVLVGAIASGRVRLEGGLPVGGFFDPWLAPFPVAVGAFTLALFAFLAAVYLALEAEDPALRDDFRARALGAGAAVGVLALAVFLLAREGAPRVFEGLRGSAPAWTLHIATGVCATGAFAALLARRFRIARAAAAGQVALILWGWALAQHPYLIVPDVTIAGAAAPRRTLELLLYALVAGGVLLFPSFVYLYRVFKAR